MDSAQEWKNLAPEYRGSKSDWTNTVKPLSEEEKNSGDYTSRIKFYNEHADTYDDDVEAINSKGARYAALTLHKYLDDNEEAEIIDVGCGTGREIILLKKYGKYPNVTGLDASEGMLKIAREKGLLKESIQACFERKNDNLPSDKWDAVLGTGVFAPGHFHPETVFEMARIVKPDGIIVIAYRESLLERDLNLFALPSCLQRLVDDGICEKLEESIIPDYMKGLNGKILALRKRVQRG